MPTTRILPTALATLLLVLQAQLWFGRGSLLRVSELEHKLSEQKSANEAARHDNERLTAEVSDLKEGLHMVEERARHELGMVKPNEIFVHITPSK